MSSAKVAYLYFLVGVCMPWMSGLSLNFWRNGTSVRTKRRGDRG